MTNTRPYKYEFEYMVDRVCEFLNEERARHQYNYYHLCYADLLHLLTCESYVERRDDKEPSKIVNQLRRKRFGQWISALTCPCGHQFNIYQNHNYSTTYIEYIALQLELGYSQWLVPPHPADQE